jgi:hypothetical protein
MLVAGGWKNRRLPAPSASQALPGTPPAHSSGGIERSPEHRSSQTIIRSKVVIRMPFVSKAQQRFMESKDSPLSENQKREWEGATNFKSLPEHKPKPRGKGRASNNTVRRSHGSMNKE